MCSSIHGRRTTVGHAASGSTMKMRWLISDSVRSQAVHAERARPRDEDVARRGHEIARCRRRSPRVLTSIAGRSARGSGMIGRPTPVASVCRTRLPSTNSRGHHARGARPRQPRRASARSRCPRTPRPRRSRRTARGTASPPCPPAAQRAAGCCRSCRRARRGLERSARCSLDRAEAEGKLPSRRRSDRTSVSLKWWLAARAMHWNVAETTCRRGSARTPDRDVRRSSQREVRRDACHGRADPDEVGRPASA